MARVSVLISSLDSKSQASKQAYRNPIYTSMGTLITKFLWVVPYSDFTKLIAALVVAMAVLVLFLQEDTRVGMLQVPTGTKTPCWHPAC